VMFTFGAAAAVSGAADSAPAEPEAVGCDLRVGPSGAPPVRSIPFSLTAIEALLSA
jgi:hypothetical protein